MEVDALAIREAAVQKLTCTQSLMLWCYFGKNVLILQHEFSDLSFLKFGILLLIRVQFLNHFASFQCTVQFPCHFKTKISFTTSINILYCSKLKITDPCQLLILLGTDHNAMIYSIL